MWLLKWFCIGLVSFGAGIGSACAQAPWPAKVVRLIVPFPAGGATDILVRGFAQALSEQSGQSIVVENKPGAAGAIGSDIVAKAAPDGYTLLIGTSSTHSIGPHLSRALPYDAQRDFTPIVELAVGTSLMVVSPTLKVANVAEFVALAKSSPRPLTYGSSGIGSIPHLMAAYFAAMAHIEATHIPYKGSSQSYPDLKEGQIDFLFDSIVSAMPQVKAGHVRALAVTGKARSPLAPELPTVAESGVGQYATSTWFGLLGPRAMPPALVAQIHGASIKALKTPAMIARFADLGLDATASTPAEFAATIARDYAMWGEVIRSNNISDQ